MLFWNVTFQMYECPKKKEEQKKLLGRQTAII